MIDMDVLKDDLLLYMLSTSNEVTKEYQDLIDEYTENVVALAFWNERQKDENLTLKFTKELLEEYNFLSCLCGSEPVMMQ